MKKELTKRLIASLIFDFSHSKTFWHTPVVSWTFHFSDKAWPIKIDVRYGWTDKEFKFKFNDHMRKVLLCEDDQSIGHFSQLLIIENYPDYKGPLEIENFNEHYHLSNFGRELPFCKNFEAVKKHYGYYEN